MLLVLAVAAFGATGALVRYGLDRLIEHHVVTVFPWSTFVINMTGSFAAGVAVAVLVDRHDVPAWVRTGVVCRVPGRVHDLFDVRAGDPRPALRRPQLPSARERRRKRCGRRHPRCGRDRRGEDVLAAAELARGRDCGLHAEHREARQQRRPCRGGHRAVGHRRGANRAAEHDERKHDRPEQRVEVVVRAVEHGPECLERDDRRGRNGEEQRVERHLVRPRPVRRCCRDHEPNGYRPTSHGPGFGASPEAPSLRSPDSSERSSAWPMCR